MSTAFSSADDQEAREHGQLQCYLQAISRYKPLTSEEEAALVQRLRFGEREALDPLVNANLHHVVVIARTYLHRGLGSLDLIAEGTTGLIKAARCFDAGGGFRFMTCAKWWIARSIEEALDAQATAAHRSASASVRGDAEAAADRHAPDEPPAHGRLVRKSPRAPDSPRAEP